jgi:hypothetical protein
MRSDIHKARKQAAALREALLAQKPTDLERCLTGLCSAVGGFQRLECKMAASQPADPGERARLQRELEVLREDLRRAARLIEHGQILWQGWARLVGAASGYTAAGEPAPLAASGRVSVRG